MSGGSGLAPELVYLVKLGMHFKQRGDSDFYTFLLLERTEKIVLEGKANAEKIFFTQI